VSSSALSGSPCAEWLPALVGAPNPMTLSTMECTSGTLGTGIATSGGMTTGGLGQAATFNRLGYDWSDYDTYAVCGDGRLMEYGCAAQPYPANLAATSSVMASSVPRPRW
jgi:transketolase